MVDRMRQCRLTARFCDLERVSSPPSAARGGFTADSAVIVSDFPRGGSKLARVIGLLERDRGATIEELITATGCLAHTGRAALTGLRKRGYAVAIDRSDDKRGSFYRISAGETGVVEGPANSEMAGRKEQGRSEPQAHQAP